MGLVSAIFQVRGARPAEWSPVTTSRGDSYAGEAGGGRGRKGEILVPVIRSWFLLFSFDLRASIMSFLTHDSINPLLA